MAFQGAGYEDLLLGNVTVDSLIDDVEIKLKRLKTPASAFTGRVLLSDGKPARFASVTTRGFGGLNLLEFATIEADEEGGFVLPDEKGVLFLMAEHEKGFAQVKVEAFRGSPVIKLQPFGRIQGRAEPGDKIKIGDTLTLAPLLVSVANAPVPIDDVRFKTVINTDGAYRFDNIPAGEYRVLLDRSVPNHGKEDEPVMPARSMLAGFVKVEPGSTAKIDRLPKGVNVKARLAVPPGTTDWDWDKYRISGMLISTSTTNWNRKLPAERTDFGNPYWQSEAYRAERLAYRDYEFKMLPEGFIQIEDVTPGIYYLSVSVSPKKVSTPNADNWAVNYPVATVQKLGLLIPASAQDGSTAIDLGELILERREGQAPAAAKPDDKQAAMPDKQAVASSESLQSAEKATPDKAQKTSEQILNGRVLLPDGNPAIGATVAFASRKNSIAPMLSERRLVIQNRIFGTEVDRYGTFKHPQIDGCYAVAVAHEKGFAMIDIEQLRRNPFIQLEAWGRVEGAIRIAGEIAAGQELSLLPLSRGPLAMQPYPTGRNFRAITDADGKFVFEDIPPGEFIIYRSVLSLPPNLVSNVLSQMRDVEIGPKTLPVTSSYSHGTLIQVEPGKTTIASLAGDGVTVRGRVMPVDNATAFDWDNTRLTVKLVKSPVVWPWDREKRRPNPAEMDKYFRSQEYKEATRAQTIYAFTVREDGTVEAVDVPPGTYQLESSAQRAPLPTAIAELEKEVVIPTPFPGQPARFDLGDLVLLPPVKSPLKK